MGRCKDLCNFGKGQIYDGSEHLQNVRPCEVLYFLGPTKSSNSFMGTLGSLMLAGNEG